MMIKEIKRIPRKIKKALKHPCTKSKWLAKARCFTNRVWYYYCKCQMQPWHCYTLQARLLFYLTLTGCKHSWRMQTLKCEMPSGVKLAIFPVPKYFSDKFILYGEALYPYRKKNRVRYIDEKAATYLYKLLGEQIKNKVEQLINKEG